MVRGPGRKRKSSVISERDMDWMRNALCVGVEPEEFFPLGIEDKRSPYPIDPFIEFICGRCPVVDACLSFAIKYEATGIWGGTTDYTRDQLNKRTNKARCPGCRGTFIFKEFNGDNICNSCGLSWPSF
jgi:WhiB family redox-sensing transcriptional regulator